MKLKKSEVLIAKIQKGLSDQVIPVITKNVVEEVMKNLPKEKVTNSKKANKELNAKYLNAKFQKDIFGTDSEDLKLGQKLFETANKSLDTSTSGKGEEIAPPAFGSEVIRIAGKFGVARRIGRTITLPAKSFTLPTLGNVVVYRTNEKGGIQASDPTTGELTFTAQKLTAMVICSREVIEDANIDIWGYITQLAGEGIAKKEDEWAFKGLSAGEGIFQTAGVPAYVLPATKTAFTDANFSHLLAGQSLVDENVVDECRYISSFSVFNHFRGITDLNGQYIYQNPAMGRPREIFDWSVELSNVMPKMSDSGANKVFMCAVAPNYLMIGDRKAISVEFSKEATLTDSDGTTTVNLWEQDMVAVRFIERLDIKLAEPTKSAVIYKTATA